MATPIRQSYTLAVDDDPQVFEVLHPNRVFITSVLVSQLGGETDTFTVTLYDKDPDDTGAVHSAVHRVLPTISVTSGVGSFFRAEGVPFVNMTSDPPDPGDNKLWIVVAGASESGVDVTIASRSAEFGT